MVNRGIVKGVSCAMSSREARHALWIRFHNPIRMEGVFVEFPAKTRVECLSESLNPIWFALFVGYVLIRGVVAQAEIVSLLRYIFMWCPWTSLVTCVGGRAGTSAQDLSYHRHLICVGIGIERAICDLLDAP